MNHFCAFLFSFVARNYHYKWFISIIGHLISSILLAIGIVVKSKSLTDIVWIMPKQYFANKVKVVKNVAQSNCLKL